VPIRARPSGLVDRGRRQARVRLFGGVLSHSIRACSRAAAGPSIATSRNDALIRAVTAGSLTRASEIGRQTVRGASGETAVQTNGQDGMHQHTRTFPLVVGARRWASRAAGVCLMIDAVRTRRRLAHQEVELVGLRAELIKVRQRSDELVDRLRAEARTDPLTGLGNRRRWQEELPLEVERARRSGAGLAVALIDLDRFKQLNDTAGHRAGDQLLQSVAQGFAAHLRAVDLVCRIGGDEFGTALPDTSPDTAREALERLRTSLPSGATCSVGLAVWDGHESPDHLVQRADEALYRAKAEGRDRLVTA
jgi:diguanylate cyclase (GGDEF)-like protein